MFHIHVDAIKMNSEFERDLVERLKFYRVDYSIDRSSVDLHPKNPEHEYHLTHKSDSSREFKAVEAEVLKMVREQKPITCGYVETEFVALDDRPEFKPYQDTPLPFRLSMRPPEPGAFRESELHVTLSQDESDPRLLYVLHHQIGMLSGFIPKQHGMAQIFTAQGTQAQINQIRDPLVDYIHSAGGAKHCSIKEERTVRYWMSHPEGIGLPHVIDQISLRE
jgi:hypothetical protein